MIKYTNRLSEEMKLKLKDLSLGQLEDFDYAKSCYEITKQAFKHLKTFITNYSFSNEAEEIEFFKDIKPGIQSEMLYYIERLQIETQKPVSESKKDLLCYYKELIKNYNQSIKKFNLLYIYYRLKRTSDDKLLFVRGGDFQHQYPGDDVDLDSKFSTPASTDIAKIRASEKIIKYLSEKINSLKKGNLVQQQLPTTSTVWTQSKVSLIELAYALHCSDAINLGQVHIKQIINAFELSFNIELGNYSRVFQNIRIRHGSRTTFLDELKKKLELRMDELD